MRSYQRKLRGVASISLVSAPIWATLFALLTGIAQFFLPADSDVGTIRIILAIGWVGFVSGALFGLFLAVAERGNRLSNLSLPRAALWGALSSAIYPVLTGRAAQIFWTCTFGAAIGTALVAIARCSASRELTTTEPRGDLIDAADVAMNYHVGATRPAVAVPK
ncbi:MAG: hypothetical protein ACT4OZ_12975 [Gemmatimonadota bacterium]